MGEGDYKSKYSEKGTMSMLFKVVGSECSEPGAVSATLEDCWEWSCIKAVISTKVRSLPWLIRGQERESTGRIHAAVIPYLMP